MSLHPEPLALNLGLKPQPHLQPRAVEYKTTLLPTIYGRQNTSPAPATVVGIVLGTVGGFIFLFYLLYIALNAGKVVDGPVEEEVVVRRGGSRSRSRSRSPVRSRKRGYPRSSRREVDVVEVEQTRARERETVRPVSGGRRSSGWRRGEEEGIVVDESVTSATGSRDGGTVEVFEENSEVSRPGRRSSYRDPLAYGSLGRSGRRGSGRYR